MTSTIAATTAPTAAPAIAPFDGLECRSSVGVFVGSGGVEAEDVDIAVEEEDLDIVVEALEFF